MHIETPLIKLFLCAALGGLVSTACDSASPMPDDSGETSLDDPMADEDDPQDAADPETDDDSDGNDPSGDPEPQPEPDTTSVETMLCERIDACGYLPAGLSVGDCGDLVESCTDDLLTSEKVDWSRSAEACLEFENCGNFGDCYVEVDQCQVDAPTQDDPPDTPGDAPPPESDDADCNDGIDNDGDGWTDCEDFDCSMNPRVTVCPTEDVEDTQVACFDGIDNDGNGFVDCDDFGCAEYCG